LAVAGIALALAVVPNAAAKVDVVLKSDGSDPTAFKNLQIQFGQVLFDVPMAKIFGLDIDNNLQPLPPQQRFPNDLFGTLAMNKFLASSPFDQAARGILFSFHDFNNPSPATNPQEIVKLTFTIPLLDPFGNPLGGPGLRWIKFQNGPNAGGPGGGGGGGGGAGGKSAGRAGGWLQPPKTTLKVWAGVIKGFTGGPTETEAQLRARVRAEILKKKKTRKQVDKYLKLLDDSDYMDPNENWILTVPTGTAQSELQVELALYLEQGTFLKVAELLNNFTVAITNDPTIAPTDPNNQPPGEILLDATTLGTPLVGSGATLMLSDVTAEPTAIIAAFPDTTLVQSAVEVTFNTFGEVGPNSAGTQYLDITSLDGTVYRVPFDEALGDTGREIAEDLASTVNVWPNNGAYPYRATVAGNLVQINSVDGLPVAFAEIIHTNEGKPVEEQLVFGTCRGRTCRGNVKPLDLQRP